MKLPTRFLTLILTVLTLLAPPASAADDYTKTKYPIVLVHGLFGFESLGLAAYFHDIKRQLQEGGAVVYQPTVPSTDTSETRGESLIKTLDNIKKTYGTQKFNLYGHSQGGPTIRYVAAVRPDLVASITSIGGVNAEGAAWADIMLAGGDLTLQLMNAFTTILNWASGNNSTPPNSTGSMQSLSTAGTAAFNQRFGQGLPQGLCGQGSAVVDGIPYFSIGGVGVATNPLDADSAVLLLASVADFPSPTDGMVKRCASHLGQVLRDDFPWNHMDEVNMFFGLRAPFSPNPPAWYRSHANRLKNMGL